MRLDIDRWSASSTALELIPGGRVRATAAYFRAGHFLLDSLTRSLLQPSSLPSAQAQDTASQPHVTPRLQASLTPPATAFGPPKPQAGRRTMPSPDLLKAELSEHPECASTWTRPGAGGPQP
jgi:hypothetical protein